MKREFSWAERRAKGRSNASNTRKRQGGQRYSDGLNVKAKRCECDRPTLVDGECWKCGREPKNAPFKA